MIRCADIERRITAYLDGDLDEVSASALRGHLRQCAPCRTLADDHARLRDAVVELRGSAPPEPPPALWGGVLARLGEAEVADAGRSRGWRLWQQLRPYLVPATAVLAAAGITVGLWVRNQQRTGAAGDGLALAAPAPGPATPAEPPSAPAVAPRPTPIVDVAAALVADDVQIDGMYAGAAAELSGLAADARAAWAPSASRGFDARVAALRGAVDHASAGAGRERAWQALIDYLQRAVVGDGDRVAGLP